MDRYEPLTALAAASKAAPKPSTSSPLQKRNTPTYEEIRLHMLQRLEPTPITRWNEKNEPLFLFHIARQDEWMRDAQFYKSGDGSGRIKCVDEERLDALVSRKFFRTTYEEAIERIGSLSWSMWRSVTNFLNINNRNTLECIQSAFGKGTEPPDDVHAVVHSDDYVEHTEYVLVVIFVTTQGIFTDIKWDGHGMNYPYVVGKLDKELGGCVAYPLRYNKKTLRIALPTDRDVFADAEKMLNKDR